MTRQINDTGLQLIKDFEGLKTNAYRCPAGVWTIGYGHTATAKPNMTITVNEAEELLRSDLEQSAESVEKMVKVPLDSYQFSALVSFVFNAGANSLATSTLLRRLNSGDYDAVPSELAKWVKATDPKTGKKVTLKGLVKRRAAEGTLWLESPSTDPFLNNTDMPQRISADENRQIYKVTARGGLRLREGVGTSFEVIRTLAENSQVYVCREKDGWAAIDVEGDGKLDGWASIDFLALIQE